MIHRVKVSWVFWVNIVRYRTNYYRKTRGANYFEFIKLGFRISIGMPYNKTFIEYHIKNKYEGGIERIEKENKEMVATPGFKIKMPKRTYYVRIN